ncbi:hypothetical protein CISIN_1g024846mg [Citrus sinensis]|uniref:FMN hydroxy acid dehydrogenase domain-containing protein n=2 Tax=Citrus sinensis TaxID=2711 RepID=A0A067DBU3_CITSI|nr:hypothetical protein CISIN_1g024846mg [Citrus sinensis]
MNYSDLCMQYVASGIDLLEKLINVHVCRFQMAAEPVNLNEFQELARLALPKMYYDFYAGGAEDEHTLKENVEAFHRITFRPRILVDVSRIDLSTTILDYKISAPIIIAPTALHKLANPEGEVATARAAASCNTIMVLSFTSSSSIEEVAASCNAVRFYQLYVFKKRDIAATLVQRAERNGFKALVLTADTPRLGRREADIKNKMITPPLKNLEGLLSTKVSSVRILKLMPRDHGCFFKLEGFRMAKIYYKLTNFDQGDTYS